MSAVPRQSTAAVGRSNTIKKRQQLNTKPPRTIGALSTIEALLRAAAVEALDPGQRSRAVAAAAATLHLAHVHEAHARASASQPVLKAARLVQSNPAPAARHALQQGMRGE